jgi:LysM repeat protein
MENHSTTLQNKPNEPVQPIPEKGRAWRIIAVVLALHMVLLGFVVLIQGCSKSETPTTTENSVSGSPEQDAASHANSNLASSPSNLEFKPISSDVLTPEEHLSLPEASTSENPQATPEPLAVPSAAPAAEFTHSEALKTLPLPQEQLEVPRTEPTEKAEIIPEPAPQTIETPKSSPHTSYTVKKGDTLTRVSKKFGLPISEIAQANHLNSRSILKIGQKLDIPSEGRQVASNPPRSAPVKTATKRQGNSSSSKIHVVRSGENPSSIARRYGISVKTLMNVNHLVNPAKIKVNQKLIIPRISTAGAKTHSVREQNVPTTSTRNYSQTDHSSQKI